MRTLRCCFLVALTTFVLSMAQEVNTTTTTTTNTTAAPTNAAPNTTSGAFNSTNTTLAPTANTTTLVPKTYVRRRNSTVTLTHYVAPPPNTTTASPNATTSKPNTTAVPKRVTRTRTVVLVSTTGAPASPPPTMNGDDVTNPAMTAYVAMILTTPIADFNVDSFRSTLLTAITSATLTPLLIIIDYCGANATESSSVWQANNACADCVDSRYVNTLVHFGFNNADTSYYSTTNIDRTKLPLATSGSTALFAVLEYDSISLRTLPPGAAGGGPPVSTTTVVILVFVFLGLLICVVCCCVRYCRKRRLAKESRRKEALALRRGSDGSAGRGDIYEMQDRADEAAESRQQPQQSAASPPTGTSPGVASIFHSRPPWGQPNAGVVAGQPAQPRAQLSSPSGVKGPPQPAVPVTDFAEQSPATTPGMYSATNIPSASPTFQQVSGATTTPAAQPTYQFGNTAAMQAAPYTSGTYSDPTSPADVPPERQTTQQPLYGQDVTNGAAGQVSYE